MENPDTSTAAAATELNRLLSDLDSAKERLEWLIRLLAAGAVEQFLAASTAWDSICAEIKDALEGDSNDADHDALVSVAQHLGLEWTSYEEREELTETH
jgi:hypothetical protein